MPTKRQVSRSTKSKSPKSNPRKRNSQRLSGQRQPPAKLVQQVCALTDPFCSHANGAKYPDDSNTYTMAGTARWRVPMVTDADGSASLAFLPILSAGAFDLSAYIGVITGNTAVFTTPTGGFATAPAGIDTVRIVSAGFKAVRTAAPLTSSGTVFVRQYGANRGASFGTIQVDDYQTPFVHDSALQDSKSITCISLHTNARPANFYERPPVANFGTQPLQGFSPSYISVLGGPASVEVMSVEFVIHYEFTLTDSNTLGFFLEPPPPSNPLVTAAAAKVTSALDYGI